MNIYQFLHKAGALHADLWGSAPELADRVWPGYAISAIVFCFFSRTPVWQEHDDTLGYSQRWRWDHRRDLAVSVSSMAESESWRLSVVANR